MSHVPDYQSSVRLRLWSPEPSDDDGGLSPQVTLGEFFERWYRPVLLDAAGAAESTVRLFLEALAWWRRLTRDPPLDQIDDYTVAEFATGLRRATYQRGRLGERRPLKPATITRHLKHVRMVLRRAGPTIDPERPGKGLIKPPPVPIPRWESDLKDTFSWEQVEGMLAAAAQFRSPGGPGFSSGQWWRACFALLLYTGFRIRTVMNLSWAMVQERDGQLWLTVPTRAVHKTKKAVRRVLHPIAAEAVSRIRSGEHLLPPVCRIDTADKWHRQLQSRVGRAMPMGWNAWRRTHGQLLTQLGYGDAVERARQSLDHSDRRITTSHYCDPTNEFILQLPPFPPERGERQRLLF